MSDGRFGADYRDAGQVHHLINVRNGIKNAYQQRMFLQRNAIKMMNDNTEKFAKEAGCSKTVYLPDPNAHDAFWKAYKNGLARRI